MLKSTTVSLTMTIKITSMRSVLCSYLLSSKMIKLTEAKSLFNCQLKSKEDGKTLKNLTKAERNWNATDCAG